VTRQFRLLAGDDDVAAGAVSFRYRSGGQKNGVPVDEAVAEITDAVNRAIQSDRRRPRAGPRGDLCCIHGLPGVREARAAGRGWCA
jgi:hypothetical protein